MDKQALDAREMLFRADLYLDEEREKGFNHPLMANEVLRAVSDLSYVLNHPLMANEVFRAESDLSYVLVLITEGV